MITIIAPKRYQKTKKGVEKLILKYDIQKLIERLSGLRWSVKTLYIKHANLKDGAEWEGEDTVIVSFSRTAISTISGASHEFSHLILRQNSWNKTPKIKEFLERHTEFDVPTKGKGYLIEQTLVYVLQEKIDRLIGRGEKIKDLIEKWDNRWEWILEISGCKELEKKIFLELRKKDKTNIIKDLEVILRDNK